jgi:hypothetical protein
MTWTTASICRRMATIQHRSETGRQNRAQDWCDKEAGIRIKKSETIGIVSPEFG